ncbi:MAG: hypothetical protein JO352_27560 [Chloroflexi bacterium]|nr:hypothetical protein [Chloroflexota bacterium]MBV9596399.1 hypothetical protein [Chloroflexota bacterium]
MKHMLPRFVYVAPGLITLVIALGLSAWLWLLFDAPAPPSRMNTAGAVVNGWTQVGGDTRLQYVDLQGVRCYRMQYSSSLDCVRLP